MRKLYINSSCRRKQFQYNQKFKDLRKLNLGENGRTST